MKVKDLPPDDRPRERLLMKGPRSLSNSELIAILLRTGTKGKPVLAIAKELLRKNNNSLAMLASKTVSELTKETGIGKDKAAALVAAFELSRRVNYADKWEWDKKITQPADVAEIFVPLLRDEMKEKFIVVCLSSSNRIIKYEEISVGNLNSSIVHAREVFKTAIDNLAANIILVHNHPSGNPEPSEEDIKITKRLSEAGELLGIKIFDHIIVAGNKFTSFVEKHLL